MYKTFTLGSQVAEKFTKHKFSDFSFTRSFFAANNVVVVVDYVFVFFGDQQI